MESGIERRGHQYVLQNARNKFSGIRQLFNVLGYKTLAWSRVVDGRRELNNDSSIKIVILFQLTTKINLITAMQIKNSFNFHLSLSPSLFMKS